MDTKLITPEYFRNMVAAATNLDSMIRDILHDTLHNNPDVISKDNLIIRSYSLYKNTHIRIHYSYRSGPTDYTDETVVISLENIFKDE